MTRKWNMCIISIIICIVAVFNAMTVFAGEDKYDVQYKCIYDINDLIGIGNDLSGNYLLMNDIDLSEATEEGGSYDTGSGWVPINNFTGTLNGNGFRIKGMHIYGQATQQYIGLFGSGFNGSVVNLGMSDVDISITRYEQPDYYDWLHVAAIAGEANSNAEIDQCFVSGRITVQDVNNNASRACGLIGYSNGASISNCINNADITSNFLACGIYFSRYPGTTVIDSYSIGNVVGDDENTYAVGNYATYDNVYYLYGSAKIGAEKSATSVKALTSAQMKSEKNFINWDFDTIWIIDNYSSYLYPQLRNALFKKAVAIDLVSLPNKTDCYIGEPYSPDGASIKVTYEDNRTIVKNLEEADYYYESITEGEVPIYISYMGYDYGIAFYLTEKIKKDGTINIKVNENYLIYNDAKPYIDNNGRTLCPLRAVANALGLEIYWDNDYKIAAFYNENKMVCFTVGSNQYQINDMSYRMDTKATIMNARTYAPVRYLAEAFGYDVSWDQTTRTVIIDSVNSL